MKPGMLALGRLPAGQMNGTEAAYAKYLEHELRAERILAYRFEPLRLVLAKATSYSPDFLVVGGDRTLELHEVKGHWTDDARVKVKVAAALFPWFRFVIVTVRLKRDGGGWNLEEV